MKKKGKGAKALLACGLAVSLMAPVCAAGAQAAQAITLLDLVTLAKAYTHEIELTPEQRVEYGIPADGDVQLVDLVRLAEEYRNDNLQPAETPVPELTQQDAIRLALAEVPGATESNITQCNRDTEDGVPVYDIEIVHGGNEYDFEIDIRNGQFISWSQSVLQPATSGGSPVTMETARELALSRVPGATASDVVKLETDSKDGVAVYDGEIRHDGCTYDFEIVASTGEFIKWSWKVQPAPVQPTVSPAPTATTPPAPTSSPSITEAPQPIGDQRAREIALAAVPGAQQTDIVKCELDWDDGRQTYDVEIRYDGAEHDIEIDASSGTILKQGMDRPVPVGLGAGMGEQAARQIAVNAVPGATDANITRCQLDREDGTDIYDIDMQYQDRRYSFEIVAATGEIVESQWELINAPGPQPTTTPAPSGNPTAGPTPTASGTPTATTPPTSIPGPEGIDESRARAIALAAVPGAQDSDIRGVMVDWEDGQRVYEVVLSYDGAEHDVEVAASTGVILKQSMDRPVPFGLGSQSIGLQAIRDIAVRQVPGATDSSITECELDPQNGTDVYAITLWHNQNKYEFEIVAATGEIVSSDYEWHGGTTPDQPSAVPTPPTFTAAPTPTVTSWPTGIPSPTPVAMLSEQRAKEIAVAQVQGATLANVTECKLDYDDGIRIYEVEIRMGNWEYDIEIDATTGAVRDIDRDYDD